MVKSASYIVHSGRVLAAAGLFVMFGCDVLPFPSEAFPGCGLRLFCHSDQHKKYSHGMNFDCLCECVDVKMFRGLWVSIVTLEAATFSFLQLCLASTKKECEHPV